MCTAQQFGITARLTKRYALLHSNFEWEQVDLAEAIPAWVMHATAEALFGGRFLDEIMPAPVLLEHLRNFDAEFEVCVGACAMSMSIAAAVAIYAVLILQPLVTAAVVSPGTVSLQAEQH